MRALRRAWILAAGLTVGACALDGENEGEAGPVPEDPPAFLVFRLTGTVPENLRAFALHALLGSVRAEIGNDAARIDPPGKRLLVRSTESRKAKDAETVRAAAAGSGWTITLLSEEKHQAAIRAFLTEDWMDEEQARSKALQEGRRLASHWARRGVNELGLSDEQYRALRDALTEELIRTFESERQAAAFLLNAFPEFVRRALQRLDIGLTEARQRRLYRAVVAGGPGE